MKLALNNQILSNEKTTVTALDRAKLYLNNPIDVTTLTPQKIYDMISKNNYKYVFYVEAYNNDHENIIGLFSQEGTSSIKNQCTYSVYPGTVYQIYFKYMRFSDNTPTPASFYLSATNNNSAIKLLSATGKIFIGTL